ncbi:tetratricopeptide repeat protein [Taylorella equigenitalis]|uniref:Sel1 repeat family protein n=2 Tax=Taylorella equigenitalis TaxID=29575 RepID=A0A654KJ58_TAYEM|nr:tetratricopeptide repeat protein [Taylorella equigenitalis]ADU92483.1 conserved hypothetical protein [Taylorella equigenitalis MCE9]
MANICTKSKTPPEANELILRFEQGDSNAASTLGYNYLFGTDGFPKNTSLAKEWLEKAVKMNNLDAAVTLGWMYSKGIGVEKDTSKAFELYNLGADGGQREGLFNLGNYFMNGIYVQKDYEMARDILLKLQTLDRRMPSTI